MKKIKKNLILCCIIVGAGLATIGLAGAELVLNFIELI